MKRKDFYFDLPSELIAQYPLKCRSDSKLLYYHRATGDYSHGVFHQLVDFLLPGDLLVMNDSQVIPARVYGQKASGGRVELLVERVTGEQSFLAHIKASKSPRVGSEIHLHDRHGQPKWTMRILGRQDDLYHAQVNGDVYTMLDQLGHIPLPPYIVRQDETLDLTRYQTIYARDKGSVAAPTAGLHFDEALMRRLKERGVQVGYVTLHVGAGTFRPVRVDDLDDHVMHAERFSVSQSLCDMIQATKRNGHRVIAVGTTTLRSLESAARTGELCPQDGETDIFIRPGYSFRVCDGLVTNFHLPESTLLMLVSAFIGYEQAMALYRTAIEQQYRFFSYGDASLLL